MNIVNVNRIRWGALILAIGGIIAVIGEFMRGPLLDPRVDASGYAQAASSPNFGVAWVLILLAADLALFGTLALYGYLAGSRVDGLAFWGMVLSLAGGSLFLVFTGSFAFAAPIIGKLYLAGDKGVLDVAVASFFSGPSTGILYPSGLLGTIGSILLGVAVWRSGNLSKWAGVLFAIHTPLLAFASAFSYPLELLGGLSLLVSGVWLAWQIWQSPASGK